MQTEKIKKLLIPFLEKSGIDIYRDGNRVKIKCLNPFHAEKNPSAQINAGMSVHCYGCGSVYDIIDIVGWLGYGTDFKTSVKYLEMEYNFKAEKATQSVKPLFRGHVRNVNFVPLEIDIARSEYRISTVMQRIVKAGVNSPVFEKAWPFLNEDGLVNCVDFRVIDSDNSKHVITTWFDGKYVKIKNPPNLIWGLDHIDYSKPALIVEGTKCADMAHKELGNEFSVHTWNRGGNAARYADWEPIYEYQEVYLLADRDRKFNNKGESPKVQIGMATMDKIADTLLDGNPEIKCVVRESHECVEQIKKDGGDIIEMFQLMKNDDIVEFITKGY